MIVIVEQAEAEVVPSSRLVEVEVGVGGSGFWLGLLFRLGGWLEIWRVKLISTQVVVVVEVGVEFGNIDEYCLILLGVTDTVIYCSNIK